MGVPITFLKVYNPEQFKIVATNEEFAQPIVINHKLENNPQRFYVNGKRKYARILIQKK